jgi:glycopeptide antibiotics resistance protein
MKTRLIPTFILVAYSALLINLVVLKDLPVIRIGHLIFKLGGTQVTGRANFMPFKTIVPYLTGTHGGIIVMVNLIGNIVLFVPIGFLVPFVFRHMTWRKSLALATVLPLVIEGTEVLFRVGIFDIDDVILNGLGVMIGYGIFALFIKE